MYNDTIYLIFMNNNQFNENVNDMTVDAATAAQYKSIMNEMKFSRDKIISKLANELTANKSRELSPPSQERIDYEVKLLEENLPTTFSGSIILRQNSKSPRIFSALIMGIENTPYDNACILFEIYLPDKYPSVPFSIKCITSQSSYSKFNPQINFNGDVRLSLLNTYGCTGNTSYGKWDPSESSIYQILFSVQNLMFTHEPYFNDKAHTMRDSPWGKLESKKYNQRLHLIVVAECIHNMLKDPPYEFQDVIEYHFLMKRDYIKAVLNKWKLEVDAQICDKVYITDFISYQGKTLSDWVNDTVKLLDALNDNSNNLNTLDQQGTQCDTSDQFEVDWYNENKFSVHPQNNTETNPFGEDPFKENTLEENPFGENTFEENPFGENLTNTDKSMYTIEEKEFALYHM